MIQRDLKADLELCNKATPGQWVICDWDTDVCGGIIAPDTQEVVIEAEDWDMPVKVKREDAEFMCQAREGWPHAIERVMRAEAEVEQLKGEIEQLFEIAFAHIPDVMWRHGYYVDANPEGDSEE